MVPWHCLVCPCCWDNRPAHSSLPSVIGHGLQKLYSYSIGEGEEDQAAFSELGLSFEPTEEAPQWVGFLREGGDAEERLNEEMDRLNLKGVAIIEESESAW